MPLEPMPASVRPRCSAWSERAGEFGVDGDQVLHAADLGRQDDLVARQADFFGRFGRQQRGLHDRLARHLVGGQRRAVSLVLVHQRGQQFLVERTPVDADPDRLVVADRHLDDCPELPVLLFLEADIARIDAVFRQRLGAGRMVGEQLVADIVEVADQRHVDAEPVQPLANAGHGGRALVAVDGDADDLRAGLGQRGDLRDRAVDIGGVGVGHRLDDDRRAAADHHAADIHADGTPARQGRGLISGHGRQPRDCGEHRHEVADAVRLVNGDALSS